MFLCGVLLEIRAPLEGSAALGTCVWSLAGVHPRMYTQSVGARKAGAAVLHTCVAQRSCGMMIGTPGTVQHWILVILIIIIVIIELI